jgi:hypothetical protein
MEIRSRSVNLRLQDANTTFLILIAEKKRSNLMSIESECTLTGGLQHIGLHLFL